MNEPRMQVRLSALTCVVGAGWIALDGGTVQRVHARIG
jgi:hypothetical protein